MPDRTLNVLQTDFHQSWSGQTARVLYLSRELARRGHAVTIATRAGSVLGQRARQAGLKVFDRVLFKKPGDLIALSHDIRTLGKLLRGENFDLVHVHGSQDTWAVALALKAYSLKQPVLMTRHNSKPVGFHAFNRWLYRSAIRRVVAVSAGTAEKYRQFFDANILRREDVVVIHSCIDVERFGRALHPEKIRAELGASAEDPIIGLVGRIDRDKGHLVLLDAMPQVLQAFPGALFVFVGKGGRMQRIVAEAVAERGLQRSVKLLGFREDVPDLTAAMDVSVLPALGTDSSPAVLKEAFFLGKPVVASRIGGIPEIVTEAAGILVAPGDAQSLAGAIVSVLKNRGANCRPHAGFPERFTPEYLCSAYLRVYCDMLDGKAVQ